jgi:hypothetical protein
LMGYFELGKNNDFLGLTRIGKRENHWNVKHLFVSSLYDFLTQLWGEQKTILFWKALNEVSVLYYKGFLFCHLDVMKSILM